MACLVPCMFGNKGNEKKMILQKMKINIGKSRKRIFFFILPSRIGIITKQAKATAVYYYNHFRSQMLHRKMRKKI